MIKANITWNCKQIAKMVGNNCLKFDNALQRGYVWDAVRQSMLIDSILRGYPIPPMYTLKTEEVAEDSKKGAKVYDCLDGKQRCTTITKFKANEIKLKGLEPFTLDDGEEIDINGMVYDDLPEELADIFDSYSLTVYFFTDTTEEEVMEMMARLNNGKAMTGYENTRIKARDLEGIKELGSHVLFNRYSATQIRNYTNEDLVIKTYIMLNDPEPDLNNKNIKPLIENLVFEEADKDEITQIFDLIDDLCSIIDKKLAKKILSKTHFVSLIPYYKKCIENEAKIGDIAEFLTDFFDGSPTKSEIYNNNCHDGSNHKDRIKLRVKEIEKYEEMETE